MGVRMADVPPLGDLKIRVFRVIVKVRRIENLNYGIMIPNVAT